MSMFMLSLQKVEQIRVSLIIQGLCTDFALNFAYFAVFVHAVKVGTGLPFLIHPEFVHFQEETSDIQLRLDEARLEEESVLR